jgi:two-component system, NarL family, response regulator LiaR
VADPIRVLVVDDHGVVRQGLRGLLELQDGIEVVGDAEDGEAGVEAATRLRPDVILMDLVMPKLDGSRRCGCCGSGSPRHGWSS